MTADVGRPGRATGLTDRHAERSALDRLVDAVRVGAARALVVRGDPGVGKTALLDYLAGRASDSGCQIERAVSVQSEMELAFAGLHQLCAPMPAAGAPLVLRDGGIQRAVSREAAVQRGGLGGEGARGGVVAGASPRPSEICVK
jgi:hypothetical protein